MILASGCISGSDACAFYAGRKQYNGAGERERDWLPKSLLKAPSAFLIGHTGCCRRINAQPATTPGQALACHFLKLGPDGTLRQNSFLVGSVFYIKASRFNLFNLFRMPGLLRGFQTALLISLKLTSWCSFSELFYISASTQAGDFDQIT